MLAVILLLLIYKSEVSRTLLTCNIVVCVQVHAGSRTVKSPADRKFRCDHCERRFFTRKDVRRHLVVHTGKRDFLCQFCPQRFGRKDHLVRVMLNYRSAHFYVYCSTLISNSESKHMCVLYVDLYLTSKGYYLHNHTSHL